MMIPVAHQYRSSQYFIELVSLHQLMFNRAGTSYIFIIISYSMDRILKVATLSATLRWPVHKHKSICSVVTKSRVISFT